jgi:phosphoenolpyruvate carboxykinase (ATP)
MSVKTTRACINAILDGSIANAEFDYHPVFNVEMPKELNGVPAEVCNPRNAWADKDAYDAQAAKLSNLFKKNFVKYTGEGVTDYTEFGPA